jgi:UDP-N-acetylglucosamine acyltransferase
MSESDSATATPPVIHPTAVVGREVNLGAGVQIGPLCLVEGRVKIGARTRLIGHATILGNTEIGADNVLHPGCVLGGDPQDIAYTGGVRILKIGNNNIFREGATVHRASEHGTVTTMGDGNFMMQNSHVAHDCRIGNATIIAGNALLAGWVEMGDGAIVSGNSVVHQYCRIGRLAMMQGLSGMSRDLPPFCIAAARNTLRGINIVGLRRAGLTPAAINALRHAFAALFGKRQNLKAAIDRLQAEGSVSAEVRELIDFIRTSKRGVLFGPRDSGADRVMDE